MPTVSDAILKRRLERTLRTQKKVALVSSEKKKSHSNQQNNTCA